LRWFEEKETLGKSITILMYDVGAIRTWFRDKPSGWTLVSGIWSPFYIQLRPICSYDNAKYLLKCIGKAVHRIIQEEAPNVNRLLGIAFAGIPIAIATTMVSGIPSNYTRKESQNRSRHPERAVISYGEHALVEGELADGDVVAIVDDVVTKFDSKLMAISQMKQEIRRRQLNGKIECKDVIVIVDREQGAMETAKQLGMKLHSLIPFSSKGIEWLKEHITTEEYTVIKQYLREPSTFQDKRVQLKLKKAAQISRNQDIRCRTGRKMKNDRRRP
jgi:orotate phosphoribosyltransferase